jgi:hypothetical protein
MRLDPSTAVVHPLQEVQGELALPISLQGVAGPRLGPVTSRGFGLVRISFPLLGGGAFRCVEVEMITTHSGTFEHITLEQLTLLQEVLTATLGGVDRWMLSIHGEHSILWMYDEAGWVLSREDILTAKLLRWFGFA